MIDRHFVESFLRLNNITENMSDETLRDAFRSADWSEEEIDHAIALLRGENVATSNAASSRADKLFAPYRKYTSQDLSLLLGIDVVIDPHTVRAAQKQYTPQDIGRQAMLYAAATLLACGIALAVGWALLYYGDIASEVELF